MGFRVQGLGFKCYPEAQEDLMGSLANPPLIPGSASGLIKLFVLFTPVTVPGRSLSLELSDARVYAPQIRVRLVTTAQSCEVVDEALDADSGESEKDSY